MTSKRRNACEVAVIAAGPYVLSFAPPPSHPGLSTRVSGEPMSFWRRHMPKGMKLRSPWNATDIADPHGTLSLDAYASRRGLERRGPIKLESFIDYGVWF